MDVTAFRTVSVIAIALIYMLFDVFNRRSIPNEIVYASVIYALFIAVVYFNPATVTNLAIAAIVFIAGYAIYRIGQIGAADVAEFIVISLLIPLQPVEYGFGPAVQLPFIISVLIDAGIAALILFPLYYIPKGYGKIKDPISTIRRRDFYNAVIIGLTYAFFMIFLVLVLNIGMSKFLLLALIMLSSISIVLFQRLMTQAMVKYVPATEFESGDMIALNLMSQDTLARTKARVKSFERLIDDKMIAEMRRKRIKTRFPVYKEGMPFAVAIFVGTIISISIGNLLLFILL